MAFKSKIQPLCRCCGKPIAKATTTVRFNIDPEPMADGNVVQRGRAESPKTKAEAQALINHGTVVSVRKGNRREFYTSTIQDSHRMAGQPDRKPFRATRQTDEIIITEAGVWDGESWQAEYFDTNTCAITFAHAWAALGKATRAYNEALTAQQAKLKPE